MITKIDISQYFNSEADESKTKDETVTIIVSVNGKMRDKIEVSHDATREEVEKLMKENV